MTKTEYSGKLRRGEWADRRSDYIARMRPEGDDTPIGCESCSEEDSLQLHHRRYIEGRDPWDYPDSDLILLCRECHEHIHSVETLARDLIRSIDPDVTYEFEQFLEALKESGDDRTKKVALAHAKNAVRRVGYGRGMA